MNQQTTPTSGANGHSTLDDIFVLSDEQILEIDPEPQDVEVSVAPGFSPASVAYDKSRDANVTASATADAALKGSAAPQDATPAVDATATPDSKATSAPFANSEDIRALADLYPGGLLQAKTAAERARTLDEIDVAYFGAPNTPPEQISAARSQLAQRMLRENPAAFREMVFAGLRALEDLNVAPPFRAASAPNDLIATATGTEVGLRRNDAGLKPGATFPNPGLGPQHASPQLGNALTEQVQARAPSPPHGAPAPPEHLAAYAAFEKAANADLEKSVGGAIERALHQALPSISATDQSSSVGAQHPAPLQARLSQTIRQDVERALQTDGQLSKQIAQILSARRFDNETRSQVVRLINDRALQLVPGAAKRALSDWTHATLAAHRSRTSRAEAASSRREVPTTAPAPRDLRANTQSEPARSARNDSKHSPSKNRVNYGKLTDEQILDL